jgi:hypothetical protein
MTVAGVLVALIIEAALVLAIVSGVIIVCLRVALPRRLGQS